MNNINVDIIAPNLTSLKYQTSNSSGFDLPCKIDGSNIEIKPGETKLIHTGIYVAVPEGYELQIRPRSGISLKTKLRIGNSPGTIDSDYRGEVGIICDNISNPSNFIIKLLRFLTKKKPIDPNTIIINNGDRIAQGIFVPVVHVNFNYIKEFNKETERGSRGFGSTGVKT